MVGSARLRFFPVGPASDDVAYAIEADDATLCQLRIAFPYIPPVEAYPAGIAGFLAQVVQVVILYGHPAEAAK